MMMSITNAEVSVLLNYCVCTTMGLFHLPLLQYFFFLLKIITWNYSSASKEFLNMDKFFLFPKKKLMEWWKSCIFFTMSVFAMFSSLIGIANTDQIISSVFKKPWLSAVPLQAFQMEMHRNDQKKIADLVFEVLLPFVLWFCTVPFLNSFFLI